MDGPAGAQRGKVGLELHLVVGKSWEVDLGAFREEVVEGLFRFLGGGRREAVLGRGGGSLLGRGGFFGGGGSTVAFCHG